MKHLNDSLFPLYEQHVRITFNGAVLQVEGLPGGSGSASLPSLYSRGLLAIWHLLQTWLPLLGSITLTGIWFSEDALPFCAFDLWVQQDREGFFLPSATTAALLQENGIPYFHKPII